MWIEPSSSCYFTPTENPPLKFPLNEPLFHATHDTNRYVDQRPELEFLHFPITDLGVPARDELDKMVDELATKVKNGRKVYLHCWGGRGRSGLVAACLLGRLYGISEEEALQRVQRAYATRYDPERTKSPETDGQFKMVSEYFQTLASAKTINV